MLKEVRRIEMTEARIIFNLGDPDDRAEHELMLKAKSMALALHRYDEKLRQKIKYEELPPPEVKALDAARTMLHDFLEEEDLNLDTLLE